MTAARISHDSLGPGLRAPDLFPAPLLCSNYRQVGLCSVSSAGPLWLGWQLGGTIEYGAGRGKKPGASVSSRVLWGSSCGRAGLPCFQRPWNGPSPALQEGYFSLLLPQMKGHSSILELPFSELPHCPLFGF